MDQPLRRPEQRPAVGWRRRLGRRPAGRFL